MRCETAISPRTRIDNPELAKWDPAFIAQAKKLVAPIINRYFRAEVGAWNPSRLPAACWWYPITLAGC
jgi:hypothetical protein